MLGSFGVTTSMLKTISRKTNMCKNLGVGFVVVVVAGCFKQNVNAHGYYVCSPSLNAQAKMRWHYYIYEIVSLYVEEIKLVFTL
jgi:hypothetical protein